jgi:hypothetical protein
LNTRVNAESVNAALLRTEADAWHFDEKRDEQVAVEVGTFWPQRHVCF